MRDVAQSSSGPGPALGAQKESGSMELENLDEYPCIAEGGQSKIYQYDESTVLRVPKREMDFDRIRYEYNVYRLVQDRILVPKVHDIVTVHNIPCLLMDKLAGPDLFSRLESNLSTLWGLPKKLASLHKDLWKISGDDLLETNHGKANYCIGKSEILSPDTKDQLLDLLSTLDSTDTLCHGDFHPGNIIEAGGRDYIIDWSSATRGSPLFDIAHTYLLLMNIPRLKSVSDQDYRFQRMVTRYIGKRYLRMVCKERSCSPHDLFPYILIKAGERTFYGMESEKRWLLDFITNTLDQETIDVLHLEKYA